MQHWLDLEEELHNSFSVIAIHTGFKPSHLAYSINKYLNIQLQRSKDDLDLKKGNTDFYFPLFEFVDENLQHQYDLVGNRSIQIGKLDGIIHYEGLGSNVQEIGYLIPEYRKVDYFLKVDLDDNLVPLQQAVNTINDIKGIQSAYVINNSLIKSINNLIFD